MDMLQTKLQLLIDNRSKIPDEFVRDGAFWFHDTATGGYSWDSERLGIRKDTGDVVWAFDSGCSCYGPWESFDLNACTTASHKEFTLNKFIEGRSEYTELTDTPDEIEIKLDAALLLVREDVRPEEVLSAPNAEIRRYLIKRVGYESIKNAVNAEVLHIDGENELLKFASGEMYVKVKDPSTEREYLLYVEGNHRTCKSAIAWTFGLTETEYNPIIET